MQGWAKRWCIIKEGMLSYAKDDKSIVRGSLNIAHSVATFDYDTLMLFIDSGSNFFRFKFLDLEAFKAWEKIIVYYLELEDIPPKSPILNLEEIVESDSEQNHIVNSISRSLSIKQSILNNNHNTLDPTLSESRCPELKGMIENLFIDFDFLSNQITKTLNENDLNLPDLKLDVEKNGTGKENKLQFFSFRSKKENPNKSINSPQKTNSLISTTIENLKSKQEELEAFKLKAYQILEEEINQRHKSQLNYLNLVSELSQLKSSRPSSPLPSPSDPSVTFQNMMAPTRNSQHNRRRSVYSRRQSSIMTMSSAGNNDEFFDALEGDESPDLEEPVVVINESEDDDSGAEEEEVENESSHTENEENEEKFNEIESSNLLQEELIEADNFEPKGESPNKQENKLINRRSQLPSPVCGEEISFLGILRKNVGKDLSTVTLPVSLNEPLNILQRLCEELEYFELLNKANTTDDSLERLIYITAFAISPYAASGQRSARKPFNPLLGETFEYIREDYGFKFISEKVSHNPPIFACYSESENYEFWQESSPKSKFWGKSMELNSGGTSHIRLKKYNEHYTYNKAVGWMRNLVGGNKYLEYSGEVIVKNQTSKEYSKVSFKESTFFVSSNNEIKATIFNNKGKSMYQLEGQWSHSILWNKGNDHLEVIFRPNPPIANSAKMYNFTKFAVELNELTPDIKDKLPITDTRYRPDQRYFEEGKVELAEQEKSRVEELQRARRRHREQNNITYTPVWFELKPTIDYEGKKCESWQYKGGYFEARESKSFNNLPNLWN
ncbi:hypothetical protein K502DRAFT_331353 [Neoconidiobolus thromboides FSU 785]|nr:hypothetical protein K502DRAFT_331353 [Neoconidiobolus thromboides FSU 785]